MIQSKRFILSVFILSTAFLLTLTSCSLFGSKKEKAEKVPPDKIVTVEGMETIKGVNPSKSETPPSKKPPTPTTPLRKETDPNVASAAPRPSYSPSLPFLQVSLKRKVGILNFENHTSYKEEKIG